MAGTFGPIASPAGAGPFGPCTSPQRSCSATWPAARSGAPAKEAGLALAGLVLGWGAVILGIVLIAVALAIAAGMHGAMPMR